MIGTSTEVGSCFSLKYKVRHVSYAISKLLVFLFPFNGICQLFRWDLL